MGSGCGAARGSRRRVRARYRNGDVRGHRALVEGRVRVEVLVCLVAVACAVGVWVKWGAPLSDYQRLNQIELRLDALERHRETQ